MAGCHVVSELYVRFSIQEECSNVACQRHSQNTIINPSPYAALARNFRTTSRICTPPPSSPTHNVASVGTAAAGSQPIRGVDSSTARRLVQEHQRRLYESRKMKSRNAAFYVAGAVSPDAAVKVTSSNERYPFYSLS